jgi:gas vesicle protein
MAHNGNSSATLEREVDAQRHRVESTIDEIKERLSPGQLIDEMLSYTKHGGAHFASSLGHTLSANPVPAALLGVSLAWLMMGPKHEQDHKTGSQDRKQPYREYGHALEYGAISGSGLQRVSHTRDEHGHWYSEFIDDGGKKYRARSDEHGRRSGHFIDDAGRVLGGFVDEAGQRVEQFRDEAGSLLDDATGWASDTWNDIANAASRSGNELADSAAHMARDIQHEAGRLSRTAMRTLEEQPLIAASLAFAAGAALGAVLPATREEDEAIGKIADDVKREAAHMAGDLYEQCKEKVAEAYGEASDKAGEVYSDAKRKLSGEAGAPVGNGQRIQH